MYPTKIRLCSQANQINSCTLVPTVFLRPWENVELQVRFSFINSLEKGNSNFYFRFMFSHYTENEIGTSIFVFRFPMTSYNHENYNCHFRFSSSIFVRH